MSDEQLLLCIIVTGLVVAAALVFQIVWTLRAARSAHSSWVAATARPALLIGAATGFCCGFVRWQPSDDIKYIGFPVPGVLLQLENGRWVDYVGPPTVVPRF